MKRLFVLPALLLLALSCAYAQTGGALLSQARAEQDVSKRIKLLTQSIEKAPKLATSYHLRGDAYRLQGKYASAVKDYSSALELTPNNAFRYYARGLAYADDHKYTLAVSDFSKAISLKPDHRDFYFSRAEAEMKLERYDEALKDYKKYSGKRTPSVRVGQAMAVAWINTYKYAAAERELTRLLALQPENAELYYLLGRVYQGRDLPDEAVSAYSKAINRDPQLAAAYRYRASVFKEMGELDASSEDYGKLLELQPDALFYNRRGLVYEEKKDFASAVKEFNKAIELNPKWAIPYNNRGYAYLNQKQYAQAQEDFETAIKLDGSMPTPYINLAGLAWQQKKDKKATYQYLEQALKHNFKDFDSLYDEDQKGWLFKGINRTAEFRAVMYK